MKKVLRNYVILGFLLLCGTIFFVQHAQNYKVQLEIKSQIVRHPENLPTSESAKITSFGFQKIMADIYWLQTIQYIGGNAIAGEYKKYLGEMIDLITDLDPYFEKPYTIGLLLLPSKEKKYQEKIKEDTKKAVALGLKAMEQFCDMEKVDLIFKENDLRKISTQAKFDNPCQGYIIPYYLAYVYFFHKDEPIVSAAYYKVAAAHSDAPEGAKLLAALMQGKGGNRYKAINMFLSLANTAPGDKESCSVIASEIGKVYSIYVSQNRMLDDAIVENIENIARENLEIYINGPTGSGMESSRCDYFIAKAIREINLTFLDQADMRFRADHPDKKSAYDPEMLKRTGYITFIPKDYQYMVNGDAGIVYEFNEDSERFDFQMGFPKEE